MENWAQAALTALFWTGLSGIAGASEPFASEAKALTGLEFFDQTFGPASSSCELGIVATGSPLVILRTSQFAEAGGLVPSDRVLAVDGRLIPDHAALREVLGSRNSADGVDVTVYRDDEVINVPMRCRDATPVLDAREEALDSASESRWNDCVRATYIEEIYWGGSNSQSAGLRLWCHRASQTGTAAGDTRPLNPTHARLLYEYVSNLLVESRSVAGISNEFRARLDRARQQIADSGYIEIASNLSVQLSLR
jgi:hypothetical protein